MTNITGGSFSGKTAGSGPANRGSNPRPPATMVPSSSGLGRRPLTPVTRVRVPLGLSGETQPLDFPQYSQGVLSLVSDDFRPFWAHCAQKKKVLNILLKSHKSCLKNFRRSLTTPPFLSMSLGRIYYICWFLEEIHNLS
jgi:hypothetical protein